MIWIIKQKLNVFKYEKVLYVFKTVAVRVLKKKTLNIVLWRGLFPKKYNSHCNLIDI